MNGPSPVFRLGTRGSRLALWQAHHVAHALEKAHPELSVEVVVIQTRGDRILNTPLPQIGGKGLFTAELEAALHRGTIHAAVHSLKDLPTEEPEGLTLGAILERGPVHDVLVPRDGDSLETLPPGAAVGTSSRRRAAQILHRRPDLRVRDIRGNVDTRIRKVLDPDGPYAATVLAQAGLQRLGLETDRWVPLPLDVMLPAPGQGALAVQCQDVPWVRELLAAIDHPPTRAAVGAERAFLAELGGGCAIPVAALATVVDRTLHLRGRVLAEDGSTCIQVEARGSVTDPPALGRSLARQALAQGAGKLLHPVEGSSGPSNG